MTKFEVKTYGNFSNVQVRAVQPVLHANEVGQLGRVDPGHHIRIRNVYFFTLYSITYNYNITSNDYRAQD